MSRTKAFKTIPQGEFEEAMEVLVCETNRIVIDEAPQAYKHLNFMMLHQYSMVEVVHRLQVPVKYQRSLTASK